MKIDITLRVNPKMMEDTQENLRRVKTGHFGTHFDVMDKEFPLDYTERKAIVFDVSEIKNRNIVVTDVDLEKVTEGMFVAFYSGYIEKEGYGTKKYFEEHPQLSMELIEALLEKQISIIGVDFAGIRMEKEHTSTDQYCANHGVFIVENLCNLKTVLDAGGLFTARTYPMSFSGMTGLPCRVVAELKIQSFI